jgi:TDG/mug DNA glycosylase family protein
MESWPRPTPEEMATARERKVPDVIAPGLKILLCGINPGLYSAATGHHFARPGNRFWPALYAGGLTPRLLSPFEEEELLQWGIGLTNIVERTTVRADELSKDELIAGARALERKVRRYKPRIVTILGLGAYRTGFARPKAKLGLQDHQIGKTQVWLLPGPSGLNAHFTPKGLAKVVREFKEWSDEYLKEVKAD